MVLGSLYFMIKDIVNNREKTEDAYLLVASIIFELVVIYLWLGEAPIIGDPIGSYSEAMGMIVLCEFVGSFPWIRAIYNTLK